MLDFNFPMAPSTILACAPKTNEEVSLFKPPKEISAVLKRSEKIEVAISGVITLFVSKLNEFSGVKK